MRYRVGRKQKVAILDQDGHQVALCRYPYSPENMAQKICDLLNKDEQEKVNLNIGCVSESINYGKVRIEAEKQAKKMHYIHGVGNRFKAGFEDGFEKGVKYISEEYSR